MLPVETRESIGYLAVKYNIIMFQTIVITTKLDLELLVLTLVIS